MVSLLLYLIAMMLMVIALMVHEQGKRKAHEERVRLRLEQLAFGQAGAWQQPQEEHGLQRALGNWLHRVGLNISPTMSLLVAACVLLMGWVCWQLWGPLAGLSLWFMSSLGAIIVPQVRYRLKVQTMVSQLPLFIDQVVRGLVTGRNVEGAIKLALETTPEPLKAVVDRANRQVELGADLGGALREAASFYDVRELHLLALAVNTSRVYGGSPRDMLESIVSVIRQREQMKAELNAMTGETRVSAWVLGLLPVMLGIYMVWSNPHYIGEMWGNAAGRNVLIGALTWQGLGGLMLWRMVKSV
jgi:tight adherence protein B